MKNLFNKVKDKLETFSSRGSAVQRWYEPFLFIGPALTILLSIVLYPLGYSLYMSFHNVFLTKPYLDLRFVGVANFVQAINDPRFWNSMLNSVIFTFLGVALEFLLGLLLALLILHFVKKFRGVVQGILLLPMILAPVVVGLIWRFMYNIEFGIINYFASLAGFAKQAWLHSVSLAMPSVIASDIWHWTPFMFLLLFAGLQSLPQEPYEVAKVDGASALQTFWYVTVPLLKPTILTALLIRFIESIRTFDKVFVMTGGGPTNSTQLISLFIHRIGFRHFNISYASAISFLLLLFVLASTKLLITLFRKLPG